MDGVGSELSSVGFWTYLNIVGKGWEMVRVGVSENSRCV